MSVPILPPPQLPVSCLFFNFIYGVFVIQKIFLFVFKNEVKNDSFCVCVIKFFPTSGVKKYCHWNSLAIQWLGL